MVLKPISSKLLAHDDIQLLPLVGVAGMNVRTSTKNLLEKVPKEGSSYNEAG